MVDRTLVIERLREVGQRTDQQIDIAEIALLLAAADRPEVSLDAYRQHLQELREEAQAATARSHSVDMQVAALTRLLVGRQGYVGDADSYEDMRNANLIDVIDRRRGLPVALGILWLHAGHGYGADVVGLSFPSHFVIRFAARGQRLIVDPFHAGRGVGAADLRRLLKALQGADAELTAEHYEPVSDRDVLLRLQNNIKLRAIAAGDIRRALEMLETMTAIAPDRDDLWWETASLQSRLGNLKSAIATLEGFLADHAANNGYRDIQDLLLRLKGRVH